MASFGADTGARYDLAATIRGFDADIVVVPEAWRTFDGVGLLEPLRDDGYAIETLAMTRLRAPQKPRRSHPGTGNWELGVCSRFPILARRELALGSVRTDVASPRHALHLTLDVHGREMHLVALHGSSKLLRAGPVTHLRGLKRHLPVSEGPTVIAGDCNLWGPGVVAILPGWKRAVRGRTWPAWFPHSQIDHVLVNGLVEARHGEVLPSCHSDHRPVRTHLALLT
ncbi:MAG: endonuclease/exonuclease/phosphatase family protein [Actinomycetota bacterium]|nr:endonuclease/exonuclease/phosphatase family protein [Actinomycetota bacterium]